MSKLLNWIAYLLVQAITIDLKAFMEGPPGENDILKNKMICVSYWKCFAPGFAAPACASRIEYFDRPCYWI